MNRFVIHIKGCSRYDTMIKEMDSQYPGEYTVFNAVVNTENPKKGISDSFKEIIKRNYSEPFIQIFEDDVKFLGKNSREIFEESFCQLPIDWDIFLGGSYSFREKENLGDFLKVEEFRSLHCVIIRKSMYDAFLSHDVDKTPNIDAWVSGHNPNTYVCNPQIAIQHEGYSYNNKKKMIYSHFLKDKNLLKK